MNRFLYAILGLTLISSDNAHCMTTKQQLALKHYSGASLQDVRLSIALLHDFEIERSTENYKISQSNIRDMITDKKYSYCLRRKENLEQYIEATFPVIFNEVIKCIDILPIDVNNEIKYRTLFFLARTGLHKYCGKIKLLTAHKSNQGILEGFNYIKSFILGNPKFTDLRTLEKAMSNTKYSIYRKKESEAVHTFESNQKPGSDYVKMFSYHGTRERTFLEIIYSMYGIKRETIEEMSKYNVLKYYDDLKLAINNDKTIIPMIVDEIYHIIKGNLDFSMHNITLYNQDNESLLITDENTNVEHVNLPKVTIQQEAISSQNQLLDRHITNTDQQIYNNDDINVTSFSLLNTYDVSNPSYVTVFPIYTINFNKSVIYSMPLLYTENTYNMFVMLPTITPITDNEIYIVNTTVLNGSTRYFCQQALKQGQQISFNEYITLSDTFENVKVHSISTNINFAGNVAVITPILTRNAFNQLMLINYVTINDEKYYIYS